MINENAVELRNVEMHFNMSKEKLEEVNEIRDESGKKGLYEKK